MINISHVLNVLRSYLCHFEFLVQCLKLRSWQIYILTRPECKNELFIFQLDDVSKTEQTTAALSPNIAFFPKPGAWLFLLVFQYKCKFLTECNNFCVKFDFLNWKSRSNRCPLPHGLSSSVTLNFPLFETKMETGLYGGKWKQLEGN